MDKTPNSILSKLITEKDKVVFDGTYLQTICRSFRNRETGERGVWEMVKRKTHGRIVAIIALTPHDEVILIKIYRVPTQSWVIEACAGIMDRAGESEETLAQRELMEETGYAVTRVEKLMEGYDNAGLVADRMIFYLGTGAIKTQEPKLEFVEDIETLVIPMRDLAALLANPPSGATIDIKLWGALYHLLLRS